MNPLVVVRDNLANECKARRIELAVVKYKIAEAEKQRKQIKQIRGKFCVRRLCVCVWLGNVDRNFCSTAMGSV